MPDTCDLSTLTTRHLLARERRLSLALRVLRHRERHGRAVGQAPSGCRGRLRAVQAELRRRQGNARPGRRPTPPGSAAVIGDDED